MKNHIRIQMLRAVLTLVFALAVGSGLADEPKGEANSPRENLKKLLQQGLFEEEATRQFDKAAELYEKLLGEFESHRQLAATALYRLAEVRRKQNRNDDAVELYQKFIVQFPDHDPLARLSRENLVALGASPEEEDPTSARPVPTDTESWKIRELKLIAKESPDLLKTDRHLVKAAQAGHLRVVQFLLDEGLSPEGEALYAAAGAGHLSVCKLLLEGGAELNGPSDGFNPLLNAVEGNRMAVVKLFLDRGADPNMPKTGEVRPLLSAIPFKNHEMAGMLIDHGADPNFISKRDADESANEGIRPRGALGSPLHAALYAQDPKMAKSLLDHGADVNASIPKTQLTPLHLAAHLGDRDLVSQLLASGAKVDAKTTHHRVGVSGKTASATMTGGLTPLYYALGHESPEIAELLLSSGASFRESEFLPPAAATAGLSFVRLALDEGISPDFADGNGDTLLHHAVIHQNLEVCRLLLERGARAKTENNQGWTPLGMAFNFAANYHSLSLSESRRKTNQAIIDLLVERGADPLHRSEEYFDCLFSPRADERLKSARKYWYPRTAGKEEAFVTIAAPEAALHWQLSLEETDTAKRAFAPTLLSWEPPNFYVECRMEGVGSSTNVRTGIDWTRGSLFRKKPAGEGLQRIEVDLTDPKAFPQLMRGDVLEFRLPAEFANASRVKINTNSSHSGWPQPVEIALNSGIELDLQLKMEGAPEKVTLSGGVRVFDPTTNRVPVCDAQELVRLMGGEHPRFSGALMRVKRPGWGVIEAAEGSRAAKIVLKSGDTLEVAPNPEFSPRRIEAGQPQRITLVSPGLPFAKSIQVNKATPTLIQLIVHAYAPFLPHLTEAEMPHLKELLYSSTGGRFPVVLPHPDFSRITIHRWTEEAGEEEIIVGDLLGRMTEAGSRDDTKQFDLPLQAGDVVHLPVLKETGGKPWKGFDERTVSLFQDALTYRINVFNSDGTHQPVIVRYDPPAFIPTEAGLAIHERRKDSTTQTDAANLLDISGHGSSSTILFKITRQNGGQQIESSNRVGYPSFLRDMDGFQILSVSNLRAVRQPMVNPATPTRRRVTLPPPSR